MNKLSSQLLDSAVNELSRLPGIGRKSALRMALYLLKCPQAEVEVFCSSIIKMRQEIIYCSSCGNISDQEMCEICRSPKRDHTLACVVEDIRDVMAIENTGQYHGVYHVLGGIISPLDGVGPADLNIDLLVARSLSGELKEIILALPSTIEGDTTNFFLFKRLKESGVRLSMIARGISIGDELEHTDELTLGRSIINRTPYESTFSHK